MASRIKTDSMIFVFGSNLAGRHGAGAARFANLHRGAMMGIGVGRTGQSYAIPTKDERIANTLSLDRIKAHVDAFKVYAKDNPHLFFQVTCIGCGLAGLRHEDIAPMFVDCDKLNYPNLYFDNVWMHYFAASGNMRMAGYNIWGTF